MLRYVLFDLNLFAPDVDREKSRQGLLWMLESLTRWNVLYLKDHPETPKLYASGVKYEIPEQMKTGEVETLVPIVAALQRARVKDKDVWRAIGEVRNMIGGEHFRDIARVLERGAVDCDNLSAFRAAELRVAGIAAAPYITWKRRPDGGYTYHALVLWPRAESLSTRATETENWGSEDPSLILGMGGAERARDREEELRKNLERKQVIESALRTAKARGVARKIGALLEAA